MMSYFRVTDEQIAQFNADGYLVVPGLLDAEETALLVNIAKADQEIATKKRGSLDAGGKPASIHLRNELYDDIYSAIVRSRRLVDNMERFLGGEIYHYHHKMTMKEPFVGGAWEWHQDYGYWYNNGCLFPYMGSCMIAVDRTTRENGCLQVIRGSHLMGRIDHGKTGQQTGANLERVEHALERMERVYCEMEPGAGLFFHCNTLHRSDDNRSPNPRWTFLACYNAARNNPYKESGHPRYSPLEKWEDEAIKEVGRRQWAGMQPELQHA
jgi:ectoine hydroxylase